MKSSLLATRASLIPFISLPLFAVVIWRLPAYAAARFSVPAHYAFHGFSTCTRLSAKSLTLRETTVRLW